MPRKPNVKSKVNSKRNHMPPVSLVFDGGNALIKLLLGLIESSRLAFTHALAELTESQWRNIQEAQGGAPHQDFLEVNGRYYAIGDAAARMSANAKRVGAARYMPEYMGVLLAASMYRLFDGEVGPITVLASHPPDDARYAADLRAALRGTWKIASGDDRRTYHVQRVMTFLEPVGGAMCLALDEDGNENAEVTRGDVLIIDLGGGTSNVCLARNGVIDPEASRTMRRGILDVLQRFESELRDQYASIFKSANIIPQHRVRDALRYGVYAGGGQELDCRNAAHYAANPFMNDLDALIQQHFGNAMLYDRVLVTGGGGGLLIDRLPEILDTNEIYLVHDPADIHFANAIGGRKLWLAHEAITS